MTSKKHANSTRNKGLTLFLSAALIQICGADALEGDCQNGHGRFDFGFAIYEGQFQNGQPEGLGSLDDGETKYVGPFHNGLQEGRGTIYYRDGHIESANFRRGQRQAGFSQKIEAAQFDQIAKELLKNAREEFQNEAACQGDCNNGTGTYTFPSGNTYSGNWNHRHREGFGKAKFAGGDTYEGQWSGDLQNGQGTWIKADGWKFGGEFRNGEPFDGTYTAPNGGTVSQRNGAVQMPPSPFAGIPAYVNGHPVDFRPRPQMQRCPVCGGDGHLYSVERKTTITEWKPNYYGPGAVNGKDPNEGWNYHENTSYEPIASDCSRCGGSGQIPLTGAK